MDMLDIQGLDFIYHDVIMCVFSSMFKVIYSDIIYSYDLFVTGLILSFWEYSKDGDNNIQLATVL